MLEGFQRLGVINGAELITDQPLPNEAGVYAFMISGVIMYVGSAVDVRQRLRGYVRHQLRGSTSRAVHAALTISGAVDLWVRTWPEPVAIIDSLPVHMPLGVEAGLIAQHHPLWNRRG